MFHEKPKKLVIGICARSKKSTGKPMTQILAKLIEYYPESLETLIFSEQTIFHEEVELWPVCDVLISFHSDGFPLAKVEKYIKLRSVWCINDIPLQFELLNRATTYEILQANGVPVPKYQMLWRGYQGRPNGVLKEFEDHIIVNGVTIMKPFVEKPVSSEDHNVRIYYPPSLGGGSQQLFRKVKDRSSNYSQENVVRKSGSYIYEEFLQTNGTDVKVYAVGTDYAHAEARKSPALDGKVNRDYEGNEVRYPVILSPAEKLIARTIVLAFKQTVCGFDLLRCNGKSYVCDVNGFSFVKKSTKYYQDAAQILGYIILRKMRPKETNYQIEYEMLNNQQANSSTESKPMALRCVVAVVRHGDRTPKQKLKMEVRDERFVTLFTKYSPRKAKIKLKRPKELQEVLDVTRAVLKDYDEKSNQIFEDKQRLEQLKKALELYAFSGINRKVQFRYVSKNGKGENEKRLQLIIKWGGELTDAGKQQAECLGKEFRSLYSNESPFPYGGSGFGFLQLHSTYRHDLKIYASDEGRVKMTAAAFTKGLLALEGELPPILWQMVKSDTMEEILGDDKEKRQYQMAAKVLLRQYLQLDRKLTNEDMKILNPTADISIKKALMVISNPKEMCEKLSKMIKNLCDVIEKKCEQSEQLSSGSKLYCDETWSLVHKRWKKLAKDFKSVDDSGKVQYDVMKIPDIYDSVKYDMEHNVGALGILEVQDIFTVSKLLADVVVPQRFGITKEEKLFIAQQICIPLVKKMSTSLKRCLEGTQDENVTRLDPNATKEIIDPYHHVIYRIFFTSEGHIHPLMNLIRFDLLSQGTDNQFHRALNFLSYITEFNYLSQVIIMLYEDTSKDIQSASRFHFEIHFSPGAMTYLQTKHVPDLGYRPHYLLLDISSSSSDVKKPSDPKVMTEENSKESFTPDVEKTSAYANFEMENLSYTAGSVSPIGNETTSDDSSYEMLFTADSPSVKEVEELHPVKDRTMACNSDSWIKNFAQNTVTFLKVQKSKFVSDRIITDNKASRLEDKPLSVPFVKETAILGYGSITNSPHESLREFKSLHFFVPPVRSLETLHNRITLQRIVSFLDRIIYDKLPEPPRNNQI